VINVKKLQFRHELAANDTFKTAKITKSLIPTSTSPKMSMCCWVVSTKIYICSFITFLQLLRGTWYVVHGPHNFLDAPIAQPASAKFGTKVVIITYSPNPSCAPNLKLLASTAAAISRGPIFFGCFPSAGPRQFWSWKLFFLSNLLPRPKFCTSLKLLASTVAEINRQS